LAALSTPAILEKREQWWHRHMSSGISMRTRFGGFPSVIANQHLGGSQMFVRMFLIAIVELASGA
jgi:hypothetical protein